MFRGKLHLLYKKQKNKKHPQKWPGTRLKRQNVSRRSRLCWLGSLKPFRAVRLRWAQLYRTKIMRASFWNSQSLRKRQGIQMLNGAEGCLTKDCYVTVEDLLNPVLSLEEASGTLSSIDSPGMRGRLWCTSVRLDGFGDCKFDSQWHHHHPNQGNKTSCAFWMGQMAFSDYYLWLCSIWGSSLYLHSGGPEKQAL